jgi:alkylresorcinol/alkylpyrone synthase
VRAFIATTLFGDGCAALIVRGERVEGRRRATIHPGASHTWPDSLGVMGWDVLDEGLRVVFSRRIPEIVASEFAPVVERYLKSARLGLVGSARAAGGADRYLFHPGGTKVLEAYADALRVPHAEFDIARGVLHEHGNMSSPTVHFVLRESLARKPLGAGETALLAALGPGFSAELAILEG